MFVVLATDQRFVPSPLSRSNCGHPRGPPSWIRRTRVTASLQQCDGSSHQSTRTAEWDSTGHGQSSGGRYRARIADDPGGPRDGATHRRRRSGQVGFEGPRYPTFKLWGIQMAGSCRRTDSIEIADTPGGGTGRDRPPCFGSRVRDRRDAPRVLLSCVLCARVEYPSSCRPPVDSSVTRRRVGPRARRLHRR